MDVAKVIRNVLWSIIKTVKNYIMGAICTFKWLPFLSSGKLFALPSWRHEENWAILKIKTTWFMALFMLWLWIPTHRTWVHLKSFKMQTFAFFNLSWICKNAFQGFHDVSFLLFASQIFFSWLGSCWTFIFQIWFCVSVEKLNSQIKNMLKFLWLVKFDNQSKNNFEIVHIFPFWRFD